MEGFNTVINFFRDGGVFLYPIAAVFIIGVVIAVERLLYLSKESMGSRGFWARVQPLLESGNYTQAISLANESSSALAHVMKYGLTRLGASRRRDDVEKAMEESLVELIPRLERRTHFLSGLANIGMLMGLLGTIIGLIHAFAAVATANPAEKASLLAASISVAMNNTALGLICAITLLLSHMFLETMTTNIIDSLEVASMKFLNSLTERRLDNESVKTDVRAGAAGARA